jgi:16S rRNA (guanine1207-N2)-methyltransferase
MLNQVDFTETDRVLDLGCGWGLVGVVAARFLSGSRVVMTDRDPEAVRLSSENLSRNGIDGVTVVVGDAYAAIDRNDFTMILSNPPYHTDFSVAKTFIEKGFNRLVTGGRMFMVTKRKEWYKQKLISVFGGVRIHEQNGYFVFIAKKRDATYANRRREGR